MSSMRFHVITIFPNMLDGYLTESILGRAIENKLIEVNTYALREYATDKHRRVDGRPYGGGPGMVMWVEPLINCVESINKKLAKKKNVKILTVIFSPGATQFTNIIAKKLVQGRTLYTDIIFICGRYEGIDARVRKILKAKEWSVGPYVLTGGELPAMICIDAIARQVPGVLNAEDSIEENRVASSEIYARPEIFEYKGKKYKVPKVLLSGHHKNIEEWRTKHNKK